MSYSSSVSIVINAPLKKVWDALTIPEQVREYFFGTNMITTWEVGSPIFFQGEWEGKTYEDKGIVLEYTPMQSFSYNYWSSMGDTEDKPELYQVLSYSLSETSDGIKLMVTQSNVDTQEKADHSAKNWEGVLGLMKAFVEKK